MLLHLGCAGKVNLHYVSDRLDRIAVEHNENFKPTYMECQRLVNELAAELQLHPPREMVLNIKVIQGQNRLRLCSIELQEDWKRLEVRINDFQSATERIE